MGLEGGCAGRKLILQGGLQITFEHKRVLIGGRGLEIHFEP